MISRRREFEVIVIGGGHAGAEAAWAACHVLQHNGGGRVALITMDPSKTGAMSCNPCIGGLAKGQIVREIDALGGLMGLAADATGIQFRVLNASRGPAVHGPRCQSDKYAYAREVQRLLGTRDNLQVLAGLVEDFVIEDGRCVGVKYKPAASDGPETPTDACCGEFGCIDDAEKPITLRAKAVVLTTGTFMRAIMHKGPQQDKGGRVGEGSADGISGALKRLGFDLGRLKTGTPPRLARESLTLDRLQQQPGDERPVPFSDMTGAKPMFDGLGPPEADAYRHVQSFPRLPQTPCWITHTSARSHDLIRDNLDQAPMYNGQITTAGPRYCPSIEDKVVRFADRNSHHVFLEPESHETNEVYCNGISTSLPTEVQDKIIRSLPGCEDAVVLKYGYAVEYDTVVAHQLDATCMTKVVPGLFTAGQINGTSGYEEAAGQGLVAGLNAARWSRGEELIRFRRDQAYIGVMMDDLVTKVPVEPYRMFTSRAEYRLQLRSDNAATRLTPLGRELGLIDETRWAVFESKRQAREAIDAVLNQVVDGGGKVRERVADIFRRPGFTIGSAKRLLNHEFDAMRDTGWSHLSSLALESVLAELLADLHYAGYIERQKREVQRLADQEATPLPADMHYAGVEGLRREAQLALDKFKPTTLGQAGRLEGVNPADLMVVSIYLSKHALSGDV
ncbi:MAG: tRNA uridine-5-carboxymethylaminomethyl(34) synthesis enzyme MnmG [Planctomycetota bacterium]